MVSEVVGEVRIQKWGSRFCEVIGDVNSSVALRFVNRGKKACARLVKDAIAICCNKSYESCILAREIEIHTGTLQCTTEGNTHVPRKSIQMYL